MKKDNTVQERKQSLVKKIQFLELYLVLFCFFTNNCSVKSKEQFSFWKDYFAIQNSIRGNFSDTDKMGIISGTMNETQEKFLSKDSEGNFFISLVSRRDNLLKIEELKNKELKKPESFFLHVFYTPSSFKKLETYKVKRKIVLNKFPAYTYSDIFRWISSLQKKDFSKLANNDPTYNFICTYFECFFKEETDHLLLTINLQKKLESLDPALYNRIRNFLEKAKLEMEAKSGNSNEPLLKIKNDTNGFTLTLSKSNLLTEKISNILFTTNLEAGFYGIQIQISNLKYGIDFSKKGSEYLVLGNYKNIPNYKVSGRLGYILPTVLINLFIPKNINEYFAEFFDLRLNGSDGKGSYWKLVSKVDKKLMDVESISESEIPRKPFRFLSSDKKSKETNQFQTELEKKILESMK